jgi:hypothetical protein
MACEDLVVGCFLDDRAPLAVPELNRERTLKYLECCYKQGMSWKDAEQQIQDCLQQRGVPREGILRQLKLARPLLQPWLAGKRQRPRREWFRLAEAEARLVGSGRNRRQ